MLEPWIIEQIRRREEEERRRGERPQLEMPVEWPEDDPEHVGQDEPEEKEKDRGVVIIGI